MKYIFTFKNCQLTLRAEKLLNKYLKSLKKKLVNFVDDIPELTMHIKSHEKNHFLSGGLELTLPRKKLIVKMSGHTLNEIIHQGFDKLNKEYEKYKGTHFKGSSKYPNHESLRTSNVL